MKKINKKRKFLELNLNSQIPAIAPNLTKKIKNSKNESEIYSRFNLTTSMYEKLTDEILDFDEINNHGNILNSGKKFKREETEKKIIKLEKVPEQPKEDMK